MEIFEYRKNNDRYFFKAKLYKLVDNKILPIAETVYPRDSPCYLFDNANNYSVYTKDANQTKNRNKRYGGKKPILHNK